MNLKYFFKNLTINPIEFFYEYVSDAKKKTNLKNHTSNGKIVWICGLPKLGTTSVEEILDHTAYIRMFNEGNLKSTLIKII